ncbi:permease [Pseudomonas aeruginosa]|nr:permease [Pseudomonas aeruginosa]
MLGEWQSVLLMLPERYPSLISEEQVLKAIETRAANLARSASGR